MNHTQSESSENPASNTLRQTLLCRWKKAYANCALCQSLAARGKKTYRDEKGVTLIELLLVLAISGLLIGLTATILMSSLMAFDRLTADREVRNEANYITMVLNDALKNTESVDIINDPADPKKITHFLSREVIKEMKGGQEEQRLKETEIEIVENAQEGSDLFLTVHENGESLPRKKVNRDLFSIEGSYFWMDASSLQGYIRVEKKGSTAKPLYVYLSQKISD